MHNRISTLAVILITLLTSCDTGTEPVGVGAIEVVAPSGVIVAGSTAQLTVVLLDEYGEELDGAEVEWSSDDPSVAEVDGAGVVTGIGEGTTQITARSEGKADSVTVTVVAPVQSVVVWPDTALMLVDGFRDLQVEVFDSMGEPVTDRTVEWVSENPEIATVGSSGRLDAIGVGQVTITASVDGASGSTELYVTEYEGPLKFDTVAAGDYFHACGITVEGQAYCWGSNRVGQLGVDRPMDRCKGLPSMEVEKFRCSSVPVPVDGGHLFESLAMGNEYTCGITIQQVAYCWGENSFAQLGSYPMGSIVTPTPVETYKKFKTLSAGAFNTCGITLDGGTYCWGSNRWGVLGPDIDPERESAIPVQVAIGLEFEAIEVGATQVCGLDAEGRAYCWGDPRDGQLGTANPDEGHMEAAPVVTDLRFTDLAAASHSTCGLTAEGAAYCWGAANGLGTGATDSSSVPVRTAPDRTFTALTSGLTTCGFASGTGLCWGQSTEPLILPRPWLTWVSFSIGAVNGCGIATDGKAYCWPVDVAYPDSPDEVAGQ